MCFAAEAMRRGLIVSRPYGDSAPYDLVVGAGPRLARVQVKSTLAPDRCGDFKITLQRRGSGATEFDVLAVLVIPHQAWYLVPAGAVGAVCTLWFAPHRASRRRCERYREAWEMLPTVVRLPAPVVLRPAKGRNGPARPEVVT